MDLTEDFKDIVEFKRRISDLAKEKTLLSTLSQKLPQMTEATQKLVLMVIVKAFEDFDHFSTECHELLEMLSSK